MSQDTIIITIPLPAIFGDGVPGAITFLLLHHYSNMSACVVRDELHFLLIVSSDVPCNVLGHPKKLFDRWNWKRMALCYGFLGFICIGFNMWY